MLASLFLIPIPLVAQDVASPTEKTPEKANQRPSDSKEPPPEPYDNVPAAELAKCVDIHTPKGMITLEMFPDTAPRTVRNFLNLVAIGALRNTTFSRIVPEFVIQGGNLYSNPDISYEMSVRAHKKLADEPNLVRHERGIVSMARTDDPDSATTDFFILVRPAPGLDNKFASFARVVKGMDVVDEINRMPVDDEKPKDPVPLTSVEIVECAFEPVPAPKVNERGRFGLRGNAGSVRLSSVDKKGKGTVIDIGGEILNYSEIELRFGEIGDLVETTFFDAKGNLLGTETYSSTIMAPGKPGVRKAFLKDARGSILRESHYSVVKPGVSAFRSYDAAKSLVESGDIRLNENGRVLSVTREQIVKEGKTPEKYSEEFTYDPYGLEVTRTFRDEDEGKDRFTRYEYTVFDEQGNWIERSVFDSEKAKEPVRFEIRKIKYN